MKLSIIVPVYNMAGDGKLEYCMDSLLAQRVSPFEVIAVDDCSTDDSLTILKEYEKKHPEIVKVISSDVNRKQGGARNLGLDVASGEWIGMIDSDDWIAPDFYEKLISKAEVTGADVVGCDYTLVSTHTMLPGKTVQNNDDSQTGILTSEKYKSLILRPGSMVIKVYKRSVIEANHLRFPEGIFYEDNCASPIWMMCFKQFEKVNEPLYYYYQHEASTVHVVSEERCHHRMKSMELLLDEAKKRGFYEKYQKELEFRFSELYLKNTLFSYMQGTQKKQMRLLKELAVGIKKSFPEFEQNEYYISGTDDEQRKLLHMFMKSEYIFMVYYELLQFYRTYIRKRISKK
ncbi:MAG: glycosyltransferase [Lachnospiraceae bacterium]|nr:glycosyltransferase [Lachnospiraceae bacterium]